MFFLLFFAACGEPTTIPVGNDGYDLDGTDTGDTSPAEMIDASIKTVLEGNPIDGISFDINGAESFSAETTYEDSLKVGNYTVSNVSGSYNGANFVSCDNVTTTLSKSSPVINVPLTFNLSGTSWACNGAENALTVSDKCGVDIENVMSDGLIDGFTLTSHDSRSSTVGTISPNFQSISFVITYTADGSTYQGDACTRE